MFLLFLLQILLHLLSLELETLNLKVVVLFNLPSLLVLILVVTSLCVAIFSRVEDVDLGRIVSSESVMHKQQHKTTVTIILQTIAMFKENKDRVKVA